MTPNIPIYRAKKIDSDKYTIGLGVQHHVEHFCGEKFQSYYMITGYTPDSNNHWGETATGTTIDESTLSIHFQGMLDSEGNKIFASLSENGKGGSICTDSYNEAYTCIFNTITHSIVMQYYTIQDQKETIGVYDAYWKTFKTTGIQK